MAERWAVEAWARLVAHFPALGGDIGEVAAEARAADWLGVLGRNPRDDVEAVVEWFVTGWPSRGHPRIGDFQEAMRARRQRKAVEAQGRKALEEAEVLPEVGLRGVQKARSALEKTAGYEAPRYVSGSRAGALGPSPAPPLEYGQVYLPGGTVRPQFVAEVARQTRWLPDRQSPETAEKPLSAALARVLTDLERA